MLRRGFLQKRLLDDEDKEEARWKKGGRKNGVLFSTVKTVRIQASGMKTERKLLVDVGIDFQLPVFFFREKDDKKKEAAACDFSQCVLSTVQKLSPLSVNFLVDRDCEIGSQRIELCTVLVE